jgi:uncharacterized RDD family membrane protein YckC
MSQPQVYESAYLARRLAAMLYDALLLLAIWIVTCLIWFPLNGAAVSGPLLTAVLTIETLIFYAYSWRRKGETLGMRAWRIRVVNAAGLTAVLATNQFTTTDRFCVYRLFRRWLPMALRE